MQKFLTIIFSCLLLSCSSFKGEQGKIYDKLQEWDKILYEKPEEIVDSLATLSSKDLSNKNKAYYSLLLTIARNKADITEKNDSIISIAVDWYKKRKDYRNTCRSILYKGLLINEKNLRDSYLCYDLKEAERIFYKFNIQDNDFKSQIYSCLGKAYLFNTSSDVILIDPRVKTVERTVKIPEEYFIKSININKKLNNYKEVQRAKLELSEVYIQNKEEMALALLNSFGNPDTLTPNIKYDLFDIFQTYYSFKKEHNKSIECLKKMLEIRGKTLISKSKEVNLYSKIASKYIIINNPDSALFYAKLSLKFTEDSTENSLHPNYKLLANTYSLLGDYKSAFEYNQKYIHSFLSFRADMDKDKVKVPKSWLGKRSDKEAKVEKENNRLWITVFILVLSFSLAILFIRKKIKAAQFEREEYKKKIVILEGELKRTNFISQLLETSVGALPKLVDDVNKHANRSRKFSSELSDDMNDTLNSIRSLSKDNLSVLAHSDNFISANPNVKYLTTLSDMEIVILILFDLKFSSKEISELLSNSQSSVRAMKTRIKGKILAIDDLPYDPKITFNIFSKDQNHRD